MSIAGIGPIMQLAFVPDDFFAAIDHWTNVLGVGPWFVIEGMELPGLRYRGEPSDLRLTMALSYWNDMQIELIRQDNDCRSVYSEHGNGGATHHVCVMTDDIAAAREIAAKAGMDVLVEAPVPGGGEVIYVDSKVFPGGIVEILQAGPGTLEFFDKVRDAAHDWDGTDPIRRLG